MSEQNNGAAMSETNDGRDGGGRFAAGNKGGPGNPFARQTAAFRKAIHDAVTADDLAAITKAMIQKARGGDVAAAKLVYAYAAGRPAATPDPDTLDAQDLAARRRNTASPEDVKAVFHKFPAGLLCQVAAVAAPYLEGHLREKFLETLNSPDEAGQKAAPPAPAAPRAAPIRQANASRPRPAAVPDTRITDRLPDGCADLLRSLPGGMFDTLAGPEVSACRLTSEADTKRG